MLHVSQLWPEHLSVHLYITMLYCIKTVQAEVMKFSLWAAPKTLVFL